MLEFAIFNPGTVAHLLAVAGVLAVGLLLGIFLTLLEVVALLGKLRDRATRSEGFPFVKTGPVICEGTTEPRHPGAYRWKDANGQNEPTGRRTG